MQSLRGCGCRSRSLAALSPNDRLDIEPQAGSQLLVHLMAEGQTIAVASVDEIDGQLVATIINHGLGSGPVMGGRRIDQWKHRRQRRRTESRRPADDDAREAGAGARAEASVEQRTYSPGAGPRCAGEIRRAFELAVDGSGQQVFLVRDQWLVEQLQRCARDGVWRGRRRTNSSPGSMAHHCRIE